MVTVTVFATLAVCGGAMLVGSCLIIRGIFLLYRRDYVLSHKKDERGGITHVWTAASYVFGRCYWRSDDH